VIDRARYLSTQARKSFVHYEHSEIGFNYRMSNICAAIGRGQLEVLDDRVARRREIFQTYTDLLSDLPGISFMPEADYGRATRWLTVILVDPDEFGADCEAVRLALESQEIEARPVWKPMHLQPVFKGASRIGGKVAERLFEQGLCLPSGSQMRDADVARVADTIRAVRPGAITRLRAAVGRPT
jgi:pyridoxal phosphate-dependent aminotransferase EpsN